MDMSQSVVSYKSCIEFSRDLFFFSVTCRLRRIADQRQQPSVIMSVMNSLTSHNS